jgi:hypothetical protein
MRSIKTMHKYIIAGVGVAIIVTLALITLRIQENIKVISKFMDIVEYVDINGDNKYNFEDYDLEVK